MPYRAQGGLEQKGLVNLAASLGTQQAHNRTLRFAFARFSDTHLPRVMPELLIRRSPPLQFGQSG